MRRLALLFALLLIAGCQRGQTQDVPAVFAKGALAGELLEARVDSEAARYFLEDYLQGRRSQPEIDQALAAMDRKLGTDVPTREHLKSLTQQFSTDLAALYFADKVLAQPQNRRFNQIFLEEREKIRSGNVSSLPNSGPSRVLYVPGWLYRTDPGTGADMADSRRANTEAGIESVLIEVPESGTIDDNADVVARAILLHSQDGRLLSIASASKGGPEVMTALGQLAQSGTPHGVKLWINVGGLLQGSPFADFGMRWPWRWLAWLLRDRYGWTLPSIASMQTKISRARFAQSKLPEDLLVVNYLGVPMASNVTSRAQQGYRRMRSEGPNDGLTLLPDALAPGGLTLLALGQDHFMVDHDPKVEAPAMPRALLRWLEEAQRNKSG